MAFFSSVPDATVEIRIMNMDDFESVFCDTDTDRLKSVPVVSKLEYGDEAYARFMRDLGFYLESGMHSIEYPEQIERLESIASAYCCVAAVITVSYFHGQPFTQIVKAAFYREGESGWSDVTKDYQSAVRKMNNALFDEGREVSMRCLYNMAYSYDANVYPDFVNVRVADKETDKEKDVMISLIPYPALVERYGKKVAESKIAYCVDGIDGLLKIVNGKDEMCDLRIIRVYGFTFKP